MTNSGLISVHHDDHENLRSIPWVCCTDYLRVLFICIMEVDYLILGQGLCGSLLSYELGKAGYKVLVTDEANPAAASRVASGVINPVTGKRIVPSWMIEELMPFALHTYQELGELLGLSLVRQCNIIDFHTSAEQKAIFESRSGETPYLKILENSAACGDWFRYYFGTGLIEPCYFVDLQAMLVRWRGELQKAGSLLEERFEWADCQLYPDHVQYRQISAGKLVCCEGARGADNPYFQRLPFSLNKGEALIASIPGLPKANVYRHGLQIVPWHEGLFWVGSSFDWEFKDESPSVSFEHRVTAQLKSWLKLPFTILDHLAGIRPASVGQRPFLGMHPLHPAIGIFNGMGSKGCSQAPFFAANFASFLGGREQLHGEADISRYTKLLSRVE